VCALLPPPPPPSTGGAWDSAGWTGTALGRPMRPLCVCGGRRCVYHLEPPRASTSRCGHRPCLASRRRAIPLTCAPLRRAAHLLWRYRPGAAGPSGMRPKAAAYTADCAAARAASAAAADAKRGAAGGWVNFFVFFCPYSVSHPPFAPFVSAEAVTAAAAAASGPAPSQRAFSSQQGALRVAVAPAEARRVRCDPFYYRRGRLGAPRRRERHGRALGTRPGSWGV